MVQMLSMNDTSRQQFTQVEINCPLKPHGRLQKGASSLSVTNTYFTKMIGNLTLIGLIDSISVFICALNCQFFSREALSEDS